MTSQVKGYVFDSSYFDKFFHIELNVFYMEKMGNDGLKMST